MMFSSVVFAMSTPVLPAFVAVRLLWPAQSHAWKLRRIRPSDVGQYLDGLRNENTSVATRKQHLAGIRHYLDGLVTRHVVILNPALSVRGQRYQVVEGKTPEITVQAPEGCWRTGARSRVRLS